MTTTKPRKAPRALPLPASEIAIRKSVPLRMQVKGIYGTVTATRPVREAVRSGK